MADVLPQAHEVLARQPGVASIDDLLAAGMSEWAVHDVVRRGGLELVLPGAYRTPSVGDSDRQPVRGGVPGATGTGDRRPAAAKLIGLRRVPHSDSVHVLPRPPATPPFGDG